MGLETTTGLTECRERGASEEKGAGQRGQKVRRAWLSGEGTAHTRTPMGPLALGGAQHR